MKIGMNVENCIIFEKAKDKHGYGVMRRNGKFYRAHRYFYEQKNGKIPQGKIICHSCDNPSCINTKHLWAGTHKDNSDDKYKKGRQVHIKQKGQKNHNSKLTKADVKEIKRRIKNKETNVSIARDYDVTHSNISLIRRNKSWKN